MYEELKEQLCQKYPFLKKCGEVKTHFNPEEVFRRDEKEKLLILMAGVQGKTAYCKKHFSDYPVISFEDIVEEYLSKSHPSSFSTKDNERVNLTLLEKTVEALNSKGIAIVDFAGNDLTARVCFLQYMQGGKYTKVILLVLDAPIEQDSQLFKEYGFLQIQKEEHFLEMGVDEVFFIK